MTDLVLLPDVERAVSRWLRDSDDIADLVDDRVFNVIPALKKGVAEWRFPLLRVTQVDSTEAVRAWLDGAVLQVDAYGGPKAQASEVGRTARAVLDLMTGQVLDGAVVTGVRTGGWRYEPDETFPTARPRFLFTAVVHARPGSLLGS